MSTTIATVTGKTTAALLGRTLMHEHLTIGYPGFESHTTHGGLPFADRVAVCVDQVERLEDLGFCSMLDPCPNDLGRDVELAAEVAERTGFQIIGATGLYKEDAGGSAYWHFRSSFGPQVEAIAELFVRELTEGVGNTGIRAGIIKVATGDGAITPYEHTVLEAAAMASAATGAPITTHTDNATMGPEQQRLLTRYGVFPNRIIVGHCCRTTDHDYHMKIARGGSYLGFDQFGIEMLLPDEERVASLIALLRAGAGDRIVVSHDSAFCWRGEPIPPGLIANIGQNAFDPVHFWTHIVPKLRNRGIEDRAIDRLVTENPRRFFEGDELDRQS